MKLKSTLLTILFAAFALVSLSAPAAAETEKTAEAKAPATDVQADKTAKKKMKPHSHQEEKTSVPQKAPEAKADKPDASKDTSKHYHPRDGK